jgi:mRNA-degrading endonuclease YafQ of YafQ-DinJ toxin-antitoxin module
MDLTFLDRCIEDLQEMKKIANLIEINPVIGSVKDIKTNLITYLSLYVINMYYNKSTLSDLIENYNITINKLKKTVDIMKELQEQNRLNPDYKINDLHGKLTNFTTCYNNQIRDIVPKYNSIIDTKISQTAIIGVIVIMAYVVTRS